MNGGGGEARENLAFSTYCSWAWRSCQSRRRVNQARQHRRESHGEPPSHWQQLRKGWWEFGKLVGEWCECWARGGVDWKDRGRKRRRRCFKAGVSSEAHISQEEKKSETRETAEEKRVKRAVELTAELTLRERQSTTGNGKQRRLRHMLSTQNYSICLSMDAHVCTANCIYNRRHGLCCLLCIFVGTENQVETHKNGKRIIFTKVKLLWKEEIELPRFYFWAVFLNLFLIPPKLQKQ